jgi:hypothetical protein
MIGPDNYPHAGELLNPPGSLVESALRHAGLAHLNVYTNRHGGGLPSSADQRTVAGDMDEGQRVLQQVAPDLVGTVAAQAAHLVTGRVWERSSFAIDPPAETAFGAAVRGAQLAVGAVIDQRPAEVIAENVAKIMSLTDPEEGPNVDPDLVALGIEALRAAGGNVIMPRSRSENV